jgi:hypothetical protein
MESVEVRLMCCSGGRSQAVGQLGSSVAKCKFVKFGVIWQETGVRKPENVYQDMETVHETHFEGGGAHRPEITCTQASRGSR